ncbi:Na+/H+ antiporter NhaC family protein [Fictibacillus enclensis]|uniref:Na+/H+ antiporter NhaC family protein n=1 Tax=Fictibacillus enclensis TaxID=1017270 RepID=UPI0025A1D63D|nr:Na+/H+ antiporter NhaC family protein [Fictibacillus enclensis]MDM5199065.1 Na+/H+ antiporter NhaC family protein [Fictibacillus enclensis]
MNHNWLSIIPFLVVIPIAIKTRQVLPGLFIGFLVGCYLLEPSLIGGLKKMLSFIIKGLTDHSNLKILLFLYAFSGLVGIIKLSGGIRGFVEAAASKIKTKKGALFLTYVSTIGTFSAPSFRFVTIAPIMRSLLKKVKMSTQELGFVIETTATPIIVLIPVATAFVGYMTSIVDMALENENIHQDAYSLFIRSIPYNFFSFVMILLGIYLSFFHHSSSKPMSSNESIDQPDEDWHNCDPAVSKELPVKPWNLLIPLIIAVVLTLLLTWWDGSKKANGFLQSFIKADVLDAMVIALVITILFSFIFYRFQGMKTGPLLEGFIAGGNDLMSVIVLLTVVWGLSSVTDKLGFSAFITSHAGWIPAAFVTPVLFIFGGAVSYFIGSAWGTWGILMPLGISMSEAAGISLPLVIGAVFASGTFGAFASPLSDDTNTIARILNIPVIDYAKYKLKPALIAAGITAVLYGVTMFLF